MSFDALLSRQAQENAFETSSKRSAWARRHSPFRHLNQDQIVRDRLVRSRTWTLKRSLRRSTGCWGKKHPLNSTAPGYGEPLPAVIASSRKTFVANTAESTGIGLPTHWTGAFRDCGDLEGLPRNRFRMKTAVKFKQSSTSTEKKCTSSSSRRTKKRDGSETLSASASSDLPREGICWLG